MYSPYVYIVKHKTSGFKYIGCQYRRNAHPSHFWVTYFTSSKRIHKLIADFGIDDFTHRIIKVCSTKHQTLTIERGLLTLAVRRLDYLNLHTNYLGDRTEDELYLDDENKRKLAHFLGVTSAILKTGIHGLTAAEKQAIASKGGYAAAAANKKLNRAIFNEEFRAKQHATLRRLQKSSYYNPELRLKAASAGGKKGRFSVAYHTAHGLTEEDRIEAQRQRGKKGGIKNKGSCWYTDGTTDYKYTTQMQSVQPFSVFLVEHPQFRQGQHSGNAKGTRWVNDGVRNYMVDPSTVDLSIYNIGRIQHKGN